jgi:hypothetical protein
MERKVIHRLLTIYWKPTDMNERKATPLSSSVIYQIMSGSGRQTIWLSRGMIENGDNLYSMICFV